MSRSPWRWSLGAIVVVAGLVGAFFAVRYVQAQRAREEELAHLADLDARMTRAADSASFDYQRPALPECEVLPAVDEETWRRIFETGDGAEFYSYYWQDDPSEEHAAAAAELEAELQLVSRLACGPYREAFPDAAVADRLVAEARARRSPEPYLLPGPPPEPPTPLRVAQTLMFVRAAVGPVEGCVDLTLRALRIGQDAAARSERVKDNLRWNDPRFGGAVAVTRCMRRLGDAEARAFAGALTEMLEAYPPNTRAFFRDYAGWVRRQQIAFLTEEITAAAPEASPFTAEFLPEVEWVTDLAEAGGMDARRYPETLTGARCGTMHGIYACDIDADAMVLMYWRYMILMAHALADGEPRRLAPRLDLLDGPIGIDPTDGSRIEYTPSESRWRATLVSGTDPDYRQGIAITEPRQPE